MNYTYRDFKNIKRKFSKPVEVRIVSSSMSPWIQVGSSVKVQSTKVEDLKPYDIIMFWRQDKLICHILKRIDNHFVITAPLQQPKGQKIEDPPVHVNNVLGKIVEPKFSWLHKFFLRFAI